MKIKNLSTQGIAPCPRWFHSATLIENKMFVFGGSTAHKYLNDLYTFDIDTFQWEELKLPESQNTPPARHLHAACCLNNNLIIFGGSNWRYLNDLYEFDTENLKWQIIDTRGPKPPPRQAHSMIVWKNELVVFGGINDDGVLNDIHIFNYDTKTWRNINCNSWSNSEEEIIKASDDESTDMSPHCGSNSNSFWDQFDEDEDICFDDILEEYEKLTQPSNKITPINEGRRSHCAMCDGYGRMWIIGGFTATNYASGMWYFDLESSFWSSINVKEAPSPRSSMQSVSISPHQFVLYGGTDPKGLKTDIWVFNSELMRWYQVSLDPSSKHQCCTGHQLCSTGCNVLVSPGYDGSRWSNDVYSFDINGILNSINA